MSYLFTADQMTADFGAGNEFGTPYFFGVFLKLANHPASSSYVGAVGDTTANGGDGLLLLNSTDDNYRVSGNGGSFANYQATTGQFDNAWIGYAALIQTDGWYSVVDNNYSSKASLAPTATNLRYMSLGASINNAAALGSGLIAEVVLCKFEPTTQEITNWMGGESPDSVWSGRTDYHYWPLDTSQATHADASGNGGPTFSVASGAPAYDADHPTITGGVRFIPSVQPLYYGATLLSNRTGIEFKVTSGHASLNGNLLADGLNGTTDASGNFVLPAAVSLSTEFGALAASDPVTLHLYWEEGSAPVVDRSLIVKTTLAEDV